MKKFLLALVLVFCPLSGLSQATIGYHRINQVLARAPQSVTAQVVPYAKVSVTDTTTGLAATIYSDPLLTALISPPVVTADANGNYDYYIPLSYCVTESITSPGQGIQNISNICSNGVNIPVTIADGGTGATTAAGAFTNIVAPGGTFTGPVTVDSTLNIGAPITPPEFSMKPLSTIPASWTLDVTTPGTALTNLSGGVVYPPPGTGTISAVLASNTKIVLSPGTYYDNLVLNNLQSVWI